MSRRPARQVIKPASLVRKALLLNRNGLQRLDDHRRQLFRAAEAAVVRGLTAVLLPLTSIREPLRRADHGDELVGDPPATPLVHVAQQGSEDRVHTQYTH